MAEPATAAAMCPRHPDRPAAGVCTRCGGFFCEADVVRFDDNPFCPTCAALPEVDYLEAFRLKNWGKRDGWAWLIGVGGLSNLAMGLSALAAENLLGALYSLAGATVSICFWLGLRWARVGLVAFPVLGAVVSLVTVGPVGAVSALVPLLVTIAIYQDTRNRLFFKVEVSRERLKKSWDLYSNNTVARAGFLFGLFSLLVCPVAVIGLPCSIIGLRRVDPNAHPPVGRRGQAIAGIVLSALGLLELVVIAALLALEKR